MTENSSGPAKRGELDRIVLLASDHNGVRLKEAIRLAVLSSGLRPLDLGPFSSSPVDYVTYARQAAEIVAHGDASRAILICGTGIGMSIVANKVAPSIRAAVVHNDLSAIKSREHNDANCLCLGAWVRPNDENIGAALSWLTAPFGEHRHVRRVEQIALSRAGRLIFANGVFDILHTGHLQMLKWAASLGDRLIVGINSDASVRFLKGPDRPINSETNRKAVLESLRFVDEVIIFDDASPRALIEELQPTILVKGGEFLADEIRARDLIPDHIAIKVFPLVEGHSTTRIIESVQGKL